MECILLVSQQVTRFFSRDFTVVFFFWGGGGRLSITGNPHTRLFCNIVCKVVFTDLWILFFSILRKSKMQGAIYLGKDSNLIEE